MRPDSNRHNLRDSHPSWTYRTREKPPWIAGYIFLVILVVLPILAIAISLGWLSSEFEALSKWLTALKGQ